jgi:hypothetical protein
VARLIGGTLAGYVLYFILVFVLASAGWLVLGANGAFQPGVWDVTGTWIALMLVASLIGGVIAGYWIGPLTRDPRGPMALAGLIIVLGLVFALPVLTGSAPVPALPRPEQLPMFEAMANGQAPVWVAILNPVLGAAGALFGTGLSRKA